MGAADCADAERHRRTPRTPASGCKTFESEESADIGGTGTENDQKSMPKPSKYHQNGSQNGSEIDEKSRLCRGCVFGAFLEGLWAPTRVSRPSLLATIFHQKSNKWHPAAPKGGQMDPKVGKIDVPKLMQKTMPKKMRK